MKNSARVWAVALFVSLVPLGYLASVAFGLSFSQGILTDYISIALGASCTLPIWLSAFARKNPARQRQDLLALVSLLLSYGFALVSQSYELYWQPVALTSVVLLAGWIFQKQIDFLYSSIKRFSSNLPSKATVIDGRDIDHIGIDELEVGQVILVRPGSVFPADGFVIQGESVVSQTAVTGELEPITKVPGDWVLAGSENLAGRGKEFGPLTVRVSGVGQELLVHELEASVAANLETSGRYRDLARIAGNTLLLATVAVAFVVVGIEMSIGLSLLTQFSSAIGVLVAAQVGLVTNATTVTNLVTSIKAANLGVLVRNRKAFEDLAKVNHVVFIKTGTITRGYNRVGAIHLARNTSIGSEEELLGLAAAVELGTSHELGHLIIQEAAKRGIELPQVTDISSIAGLGVSANYDGSLVQVGNAGMVNVSGINMNPYDLFRVSNAYQQGSSVVFVSIDELLVGYIEFPDEVRVNSQQTIVELSGKHAITILSGDATGVVEKVTTGLGITDFAAEVLSTRKADWIKEKGASGSKILLVGDGHYDAAALVEADVALAFGAGHNVHLGSAELIQISQDPLVVARLLSLARKTKSRTLRNIVVGLVASAGLMALPFVGVLTPVIALVGLMLTYLLNSSLVRLVK